MDLCKLNIFCISLKDAMERRKDIRKIREDHGLNIQLIDAIDGRDLSKTSIQQQTKIPIQWNGLRGHRYGINLSTEAACCLSHIKAWETVLKLNLDHAIIIEDDIAIKRPGRIAIPDLADFVYLSERTSCNVNREAIEPLCGAEAYYLTNDCCKKLLRIFSTIRMPVAIQWLPQMQSLIKTKHFLTAFTNEDLPTINAYVDPGIFALSHQSIFSQIRGTKNKKKPTLSQIQAPISLGELIDKITILQIKTQHLQRTALANVEKELAALLGALDALAIQVDPNIIQRLKEVNADLWQIEDNIRDKERSKDFGEGFIQLARSIYQQNDHRAAIKKEINTTYGSTLVEEKSYQDY